MLEKLLSKPVICQHTKTQTQGAAEMPGFCPICLRGRVAMMEKLLKSYDNMTTELSLILRAVPPIKGNTLTEAIAALANRVIVAERDLKIATSPKAMGKRDKMAEARGLERAENIANSRQLKYQKRARTASGSDSNGLVLAARAIYHLRADFDERAITLRKEAKEIKP